VEQVLPRSGEEGDVAQTMYTLLSKCKTDKIKSQFLQKEVICSHMMNWALVVHACNPSYSGDKNQEGSGWKQTVCKILFRKYPTQKGLTEWLKSYSACLARVRP
jgi:hypothetical protein